MGSFLSNDSTAGVNQTFDTNENSSMNATQQVLTLRTMSQRSDATKSAFDTSSDAGAFFSVISDVPNKDTGSPKLVSNPALTNRYMALFEKIKGTELLMSQDGQGPAGEKADYSTIYLKPGGTSGVEVHRFNPMGDGLAKIQSHPTKTWLNTNGFTTKEIWGDIGKQKHRRDRKERNPFIVVPDDMETSVRWIQLSDKRYPADALIVAYIIPK